MNKGDALPWDIIEGECHVTPYANIIHDGSKEQCDDRCKDDKRTIECVEIPKEKAMELWDLEKSSNEVSKRILEMEIENTRLRKALNVIAKGPYCSMTDGKEYIDQNPMVVHPSEMAQEALDKNKKGEENVNNRKDYKRQDW